jgi:hypothetical protein
VILSKVLSSDAMELHNCDVVNTVEVHTASNSLFLSVHQSLSVCAQEVRHPFEDHANSSSHNVISGLTDEA